MLDIETNSLWSHILGESMQGKLKGTELKSLPSDMVTWQQWKKEHPNTTVLNLKRSSKNYVKLFYKKPERFVIGLTDGDQFFHCTFRTMIMSSLINLESEDLPMLILFEAKSTSVKVFNRKIAGKTLTFVPQRKGFVQDQQTKSVWNRQTGLAVRGQLKGKQLEPIAGIVSFTKAWKKFHPDSKEILSPGVKPDKE